MGPENTNFNPGAEAAPSPAPSPEKQNEILEKITPERIRDTWDSLSLVERKFIITTDEQFDELIGLIRPEKQRVFQLLRKLILGKHELASGIQTELNEKPIKGDLEGSEDPLELEKILLEELGGK